MAAVPLYGSSVCCSNCCSITRWIQQNWSIMIVLSMLAQLMKCVGWDYLHFKASGHWQSVLPLPICGSCFSSTRHVPPRTDTSISRMKNSWPADRNAAPTLWCWSLHHGAGHFIMMLPLHCAVGHFIMVLSLHCVGHFIMVLSLHCVGHFIMVLVTSSWCCPYTVLLVTSSWCCPYTVLLVTSAWCCPYTVLLVTSSWCCPYTVLLVTSSWCCPYTVLFLGLILAIDCLWRCHDCEGSLDCLSVKVAMIVCEGSLDCLWR